jgi:hypothetical protein
MSVRLSTAVMAMGLGCASVGCSSSGDDGPPACEEQMWASFGHDARRSFASSACVHGPFSYAWRYVPTPPADQAPVGGIFSAVADAGQVYLRWKGKQGPYYGTPFVDAVTRAGATAWQWNSTVDSSFGQPLSLAFGNQVVTDDDGIWYLDMATGTQGFFSGVDVWGQTAPVDERIYVVNTAKVDGPGVYVGAYDAAGTQLWKQNEMSGAGQFSHQDGVGAIAADQGVLFYAASYQTNTPPLQFQSGLYAFDGATGGLQWYQPTTPAGGISAGGDMVFAIEGTPGAANLVARNQSDGEIAWQATPEGGIGSQPPVLAGTLAIVGTSTQVVAYDAATGEMAWSAAVPGAASASYATPPVTTIAAALSSETIVVMAHSTTVLNMADGQIQWSGTLAEAPGAAEPVLVGSRLYVVDYGGLTAYDATP